MPPSMRENLPPHVLESSSVVDALLAVSVVCGLPLCRLWRKEDNQN